MSRDEASLPEGEEEEPRAPAGTWASEPHHEVPAADGTEAGAGRGREGEERPEPSTGKLARPGGPPRQRPAPDPDAPARRDATARTRAGAAVGSTGEEPAADSHVRPRFLASELLRRRSESHEPIWPAAGRALGGIGGLLAAGLLVAFASSSALALGAAVLALGLGVASMVPLTPEKRAPLAAVVGATAAVAPTLLAPGAAEPLIAAAALCAMAGGLLRARRFHSLGARGLFLAAALLGGAALALEGGIEELRIEAFSLEALAPALRLLVLGAAVLLPLVTLLDANGPSGALVVALVWAFERAADAVLHVLLDGMVASAVGPLASALVLPAAALGLAQAMPSASRIARRAPRAGG